jgi:DNA-binding NarL/FixJ family response regulator
MNTKVRVLVIEDDKLYANTLKQGLESYNFDVTLEHHYGRARELLVGRTHYPYSVILIDVRLVNNADPGDRSGIKLAQEIGTKVPVLMLSKHDTIEYVKEALAARPDGRRAAFDYVLKDEGYHAIAAAIYQVTQITGTVTAKVFELDERLRASYLAVSSQSAKTFFDSRIIAWSGITIIIVSLALFFGGILDSAQGAIGAVSGVVLQAIIMLFFSRQDKADTRMDRYHQELAAMSRLELLIATSDKVSDQTSRYAIQEYILKQAAQHWLAAPATLVGSTTTTEAPNER